MPDNGIWVLTISAERDLAVMMRSEFQGRGRNGEITWIDDHGDDSSSYGMKEFDITHWMPIPSAP